VLSKASARVALLSLVLIAGACEESHSARTEHGANPSVERLVVAYCERRLECPDGKLSVFDQESCLRAEAQVLCVSPKHLPDVAECEHALRTMDCSSMHRARWPQGCEAVVQAYIESTDGLFSPLADGGCLSDIHCKAGMRCEGAGPECTGTCVPKAEEGEPCLTSSQCRFELICSSDAICERPRPAGSPCQRLEDCAQSCIRQVCVDNAELLHQPCVEHADCGGLLHCRDGLCVTPGGIDARCVRATDCRRDLACVSGRCVPSVACHAGEVGDPCTTLSQCKRGLTCSRAEGRCIEAPRWGESCSSDVACAGESVCSITKDGTGVCEALPRARANGDDCFSFWHCASGFCAAGKCGKPIACE
jgi:hypothetical protein